jgi:hypothetical protein
MIVSHLLSLEPSAPLLATARPIRLAAIVPASARPVAVGAVHLRRLAVVFASLALLGLGVLGPEQAARANGPLAWRTAPEAGR